MIEQYVYDKITQDETLQEMLSAGSDGFHLYPGNVPRSVGDFDAAVTFTLIVTTDAYPAIESRNVQFNIFAKTHTSAANIAKALADLFNEDNNQEAGGAKVVFSIRKSETDLGINYDDNLYQRECTFYFKMR